MHPTHTEETYKKKNTILAKIVVGLILIAFLFTGVQSYLVSRGSNPVVATAGTVKIYQPQLEKELQHAFHGATPDQIKAFLTLKFVKNLLQKQINAALINQEVSALKLVIPDGVLKSFLRHSPDLTPSKIKAYLKKSGQTEKNFMASLRLDLINDQLKAAVFSGLTLPKNLQKRFMDAELTKRSVRIFTLTEHDGHFKTSPTDTVLKTFLKEHESQFMTPEKRDIAVLEIHPKKVKISDQQAKAHYDQNPSHYQSPETRDVFVLTLKEDETFNPNDMKAYKDRFISIGSLSRDMIDDTLASTLFSLSENNYSSPQPSEEGRKVYWVKKITPAEPQPFKHIKKQIISLLKAEQQNKHQKDLIQKIDDDIGGGESFEMIAKNYPEVLVKMYKALTKEAALKKLGQEKMDQAFSQKEGEEGQIHMDKKSGVSYSLQITKVSPSVLPDFKNLKPTLQKAYIKKQRIKEAQDKAKKLAHQINKTGKFKDLKFPLEVIKEHSLSQLNKKLNLTQKDLLELAELKKNHALALETGEGAKIIVLTGVQPPKIDEKTKKIFERLFENLSAYSYQQAYFKNLAEKYTVKVNDAVLEDLVTKLQDQFS